MPAEQVQPELPRQPKREQREQPAVINLERTEVQTEQGYQELPKYVVVKLPSSPPSEIRLRRTLHEQMKEQSPHEG